MSRVTYHIKYATKGDEVNLKYTYMSLIFREPINNLERQHWSHMQ